MNKNYLKHTLYAVLSSVVFSNFVVATDKKPEKKEASPKVLAKVADKTITQQDFDNYVRALGSSLPQDADPNKLNKRLLDQLIEIKLLSDAAAKSDIKNKPEVKKSMETAIEQVITNAFVMEQLQTKVNDAALDKEYQLYKKEYEKKNKGKKDIKLRHILVKTDDEAKEIIKRLKDGQDFQKLAREKSIHPESAKQGGDIGYILEGSVPEFNEVLAKIKTGRFSFKPVKTEVGFVVFKIDERRNFVVPELKKTKRMLTFKLQKNVLRALTKKLRDATTVLVVDPKFQ